MDENVDRNTLLNAMANITLNSVTLDVNYERSTSTEPDPINTGGSCTAIKNSINVAGFNDVSVICDDEYAYVISDTYPNHDLMNGITGTNEQIPVPAINYAAPIKLSPQKATSLTTIDAAVGVAVNGVPIYDYSSQGELDIYNYDVNSDTFALGQLDNCGGHAGRGDDYHYHVSPNCMIDSMENKTDNTIIGWAYDGYPLYGDKNPDGSVINDAELDVCNGQSDESFGYRYHTSTHAPYIIQCLVGEVDTSILPRVSPLSGNTASARANLTPPRDGVENLQHTINNTGERKMTYNYKGQSYYVIYSPSVTKENCFNFEQKTVSNGGIIETGTFCREDNPLPQGNQQTKILDFSQYETFSNALSEQVNRGDGNNIDNYFRNSGVLIDEKQNAYYGVNGVHPINQGDYTSYYPKSVVKASMNDDTIIKSYSFDSIYGHNIDMEALSFGKNPDAIYIGDEYNYIYELDLNLGTIINQWDLADIGLSTNIDKGIEAMSYASSTDNFYVGIQGLEKIISVKLNDNNTLTKINEFSLPSGWAPSGLFAHKNGSLYVVSMKGSGTAGNQTIFQYHTDGSLMCEVTIPNELGIIRTDGIFIDSTDSFIYLADSQGPIYGGNSLYKIAWTKPCDQ
ncbi:YHYH protein [Pseudoalteromonas denitrificans]|uniref:YHYH protein n=1 Tax=Pseudoalteromonas denitrificans DSM 6059 TaxID=1123010 RepID=A0A1I1QYT1_9GAMM|nr:YHYH protein [Pseudoalteromonas denitrificans]SFD27127.1 YHYH protein [Pseudoalteromonas denitrificans DSM 6059]